MTEDITRKLHESPELRQEQLSAALDGMLTAGEQAALDAHLAGCESCARELEELRQVRALLRALPEPALPRSFLLPTEGELVAPRAPLRTVERQPAANATPRRSARSGSSRAMRTLQVTRWIGTIAAVLGLALFLGVSLPLALHQNSAASTSAPQYNLNGPAAATDKASGGRNLEATRQPTQDKSANQSATATGTSAVPSPIQSSPTPAATAKHVVNPVAGPSPEDILRIVALVLLFGGAGVALLTFIVTRRL